MRTLWIDQPEQLADFCDEIADSVISVDTESDHFQAYQARVCLIQVATPEVCAFVDPLALGKSGLEPLFVLLEDPGTTTLLHAANNDIRELHRDFGVSISNIFDTQIAATFLGYERNGLTWLQKNVIGKKPPGQFQRYDWTTRPIPPDVCEYAMADVADLFVLHERFLPELEASGWLDAFYQQCAYVAATSDYEPTPFDPEGWWKLLKKSSRTLNGRARAALRELFMTRHEICSAENRAALHIFPNRALIKLARIRPQTLAELEQQRVLSAEIIAEYGLEILDTIERSLSAPIPPNKRPSSPGRPNLRAPEPLRRALIDWRNRTARRLDLPGLLIATNGTLTEIAADPPTTVDGLDAFAPILDWQRELLGDEILDILANTPAD